ncbi:MAG: diaminopimelate decarboxylase [Bacteroidales bacterium]
MQDGLAELRRYVKKDMVETPCYVYDKKKLLKNIETLKQNFSGIAKLFFAVKANTNLVILKLLKNQGIGAEVVSPGEIFVCLKSGYRGDEILYNNVARKIEEIQYALNNGIIVFNFESINQAILLEKAARERNIKINAFIRINPEIFSKTHPHLSTGSGFSKFGMTMEEIKENIPLIKKFRYAKLVGIHCHIGSQILSPEPFVRAVKKCKQVIKLLRKQGFKIDCVNLGGGFGVPYLPQEKPLDFEPIVKSYRSIKDEFKVEIFLEPGRFFVANAGYILTRLIDKKSRNHIPLYMIDAGMTENPRPALYNAYHHIEPLFPNFKQKISVRVTGPLCENADEFGYYSLPELKIGSYLLIHNSGAYTRTMASTYNGRTLPAEYLIGNGVQLIKRKQPLKGLIEYEQYQGF